MKYILIITMLIIPLSSYGLSKKFKIEEKTGVQFHLPYTLGTHDGEAAIGKGQLNLDFSNPIATTGDFVVPIATMTTGNPERDCHMREALGLNYEQSDFPKDHVCDDNHQLPSTGKNAVVFPEIIFKILSLKSRDKGGEIYTDKETPIEVEGQLTIHGISRKEKFILKLIPDGEKFKVLGVTQFFLKDYNITVKPTKILFFTIGVKDQVNVSFNLQLEPDLMSTVPTN